MKASEVKGAAAPFLSLLESGCELSHPSGLAAEEDFRRILPAAVGI